MGVFAGRDFKEGEVVLRSWMTLFLPLNFPEDQAPRHYAFGYNKTHMALALDYGSLINHRESANARAIASVYSQVRRVFQFANHNVPKRGSTCT